MQAGSRWAVQPRCSAGGGACKRKSDGLIADVSFQATRRQAVQSRCQQAAQQLGDLWRGCLREDPWTRWRLRCAYNRAKYASCVNCLTCGGAARLAQHSALSGHSARWLWRRGDAGCVLRGGALQFHLLHKDYVDASESGPLAEGLSANWQADARLMLCGGALQRAVRAGCTSLPGCQSSTETVHVMLGGAVCGSSSAGDLARNAWYAAPTWQAAVMPDKAPV